MKLSTPNKVFDLDLFLPNDGEDKFEIYYSQRTLNVDLFYESNERAFGEVRKRICFSGAKFFVKGTFPGFSLFVCEDDRDISLLNAIVEYKYSELLERTVIFQEVTNYKHYRLFLHASGVALHVIAQSIKVFDYPTV